LANSQTISIGVLHGVNNFTHHDARERRGNWFGFLDFQPCHGEGVG
jgi:hypothetical protein